MPKKYKHRTLEQRTLAYWNLSLEWQGRRKPRSMEKALKETCDIACTTNPTKPLWLTVINLEEELIAGSRSKREFRGTTCNLLILNEVVNQKPE